MQQQQQGALSNRPELPSGNDDDGDMGIESDDDASATTIVINICYHPNDLEDDGDSGISLTYV